MSYLLLNSSSIPNFAKVVISFWFRIPQKSIEAAAKAYTDHSPAPLFNGIIPIVVMGTEGVEKPYAVTNTAFTVSREDGVILGVVTGTSTSPTGASHPLDPTIIGINCDPSYVRPVLYINFQTSRKATVSDYVYDLVGGDFHGGVYTDVTEIVTDITAAINGTNIYLDSMGNGADKWHHVLMSLDFAAIKTRGFGVDDPYTGITADYVDSAARLFVALDDVNYTEFDLSNQFVNHSTDHHAVVPPLALHLAGLSQHTDALTGDTVGGIPKYNLTNTTIPCHSVPMGLPATAKYVNNIYRVELAEFQMWTGMMLDTGVKANRRAFVDKDGKPVPPDQKQVRDEAGNIIQDSGSIEFMGKRPDILLHGSSNWIAGYNTGSTGVDDEGEVKPSGQFTPVAGIEPYKPDPSLEETTP